MLMAADDAIEIQLEFCEIEVSWGQSKLKEERGYQSHVYHQKVQRKRTPRKIPLRITVGCINIPANIPFIIGEQRNAKTCCKSSSFFNP